MTLLLRPNMKWHDGRPVTIEDAKFTFDYLLKWKPPLWQPFMEVIASAERLGDRGLRVKLKEPCSDFHDDQHGADHACCRSTSGNGCRSRSAPALRSIGTRHATAA